MATEQTYILDGPTDFFFPFPVRTAGQIVVSIEPGGVLPASAYEVIGASATATGVTIRYADAPRDGLSTLRIQRRTEFQRVSTFLDDLSITARALNAEFDNILQIVQDGVLNEFRGDWETERLYFVLDVVRAPDGSLFVCIAQHESDEFDTDLAAERWLLVADFATGQADIDNALAAAEAARDKAEQWAEEDEDVEVEPGEFSAKHYSIKASDSADAALISEQNAAPVNAIVGEITTVAGIESDVIVVAGINSEVVTVAGIDSEVATVSGIAGDVITVAANDGDITIVATNVANVNTVATNVVDVNTTAASIANVNTVAGDIANVNIVAGDIANVNTVANNIAAVVAVDANESNINAVESNEANINIVAGIDADVSVVASLDEEVQTVALDLTGGTFDPSRVYNLGEITDPAQGLSAAPDGFIVTVYNNLVEITAVGTNIAAVVAVDANESNINVVATNISDIQDVANALTGTPSGASLVSYDNTASGLAATDVQAAVDEVVDNLGTMASQDASDVNITGGNIDATVAYDNTGSGLAASDVQNAIDELSQAAGVAYDNTTSGLEATTVQAGLDEIESGSVTLRADLSAVESRVSSVEFADGVAYNNSVSFFPESNVQGALDAMYRTKLNIVNAPVANTDWDSYYTENEPNINLGSLVLAGVFSDETVPEIRIALAQGDTTTNLGGLI